MTNFALCSQAEVATHFGFLFITLRTVQRREWQSLREIHQVVFQKKTKNKLPDFPLLMYRCFKALNNLALVYISEMLHHKEPTCYNLSNELELAEPRTKLISYGNGAFSSIAPRLFNKLPHGLKQITKLDKSKNIWKSTCLKKLLNVWSPSHMWSFIYKLW